MKKLIIVSLVFISGCFSLYKWDSEAQRCRDKSSGQFVPTGLCDGTINK